MKIEKLHIYGFGKHENVEISLMNGINVFYGENEAGKSTIQQFILHILFGFPQKNAQLLRYEPKSGAMYGGKIHLIDQHGARVIIERVKGKASGDVTLYFEDGTRGGEKELSSLLHSYSRTDFEAIFSFSLLQLQGFEKMTEEELTRTLLTSGTTGMDMLTNVETQFVKEMGELFKPTGKKPLINQKMEELRALELAWKQQMEEVQMYEPSIKRLHELELLIAERLEEEKNISDQLQQYIQWKQLKPIKEKEIALEQALNKIDHQTFPSDGIRRYEQIKDKETSLKIANEQIKEELKLITTSKTVLSQEELEAIQVFLNNESEWHELRAKRIQIEEEQSKTLQSQMQQLALIGVDWEKSLTQMVQADVSIGKEDKLVSFLKKQEQLDRQIVQENRLLQMKKEDFAKHQHHLNESKRTNRSSSQKNNPNGIAFLLIAVILLIGFTFSFLQANWIIALTTVLISVIVYVGFTFLLKTLQQTNDVQKYEHLLLKEQQALKEQIERLEYTIRELEGEKSEIGHQVRAFLAEYHISEQLSPSLLPKVFNRLRMIQEQQMLLDQMEIKLYEVSKRLQTLFGRAKEVAAIQLIEEMLFHQLREYYLTEKRKAEEQGFKAEKIEQLETKIQETRLVLTTYAKKVGELFKEANVETEEDYYTAFNIYEEKLALTKEIEQIRMQLDNREINMHDFNESFELDCKEKLQASQQARNQLLEEKATLQYKTKMLIENDEQSERLQLLEQKKTELYELVKKWAAYKAVVEAIQQTFAQLKEKRLPEVLEYAQSYFRTLTANVYEALILSPEGNFEAVRSNGQRFKIAELSQATKEQAYISLRIALAVALKGTTPFPIIMDDPFVHFDRFRLQHMVQLMTELQKKHQLLYFTCHENMRYGWKDAHIVEVADILAGSGGNVK
ncbi:AAA family ATPase [Psychrobacillus sp. NEAU-3TGS]|uniref:ATP-binding protein n=1 Tax=Psychrobacillus sp. NEAU-3TGS TaxID=2995412 RepID=UPI0024974255|nr:AAA family ATPase [Psychrobacillus sp. NEAU-3TGS]MDI2586747.1 AAA family ATPase [Psychrobacillus sp. NEAU-3TGS]